jgi:hypothetical protein
MIREPNVPPPATVKQEQQNASIWKYGAIGSALSAILAEVQILFFRYEDYLDNPEFLFTNIFIAMPLNFLLYWPFFTFIAWTWRKLVNVSWIGKLLIIALFLATVVIIMRFVFGNETRVIQL